MATKKIPISFNDHDQADIQELIDLMGITGVYGDIPKAVKFGINLALATIKSPTKVYATLKGYEIDTFFSSVKRYEMQQRMTKQAEKIKQDAQKV